MTTNNPTYIVKSLNEIELNKSLQHLTDEQIKSLFTKKLPKYNNKPIKYGLNVSHRVHDIIKLLHLPEIENVDERAKLFIHYCYEQKYSFNTVLRYFNETRSLGLFKGSKFRPKRIAFNKEIHIRVVDVPSFVKFINFIHTDIDRYKIGTLLAYYTGLRNFEILQFTLFTLYQLKEKFVFITSINRKNTSKTDLNYWKPVYHSQLNNFIDILINLYKTEYDAFLTEGTETSKLNSRLFYFKPNTLVYRTKCLYFQATGKVLPFGFGIHGFRNMMATLLTRYTDSVPAIQQFLQHKSIKTTEKYIKTNIEEMKVEINRLTNEDFNQEMSKLKKIVD